MKTIQLSSPLDMHIHFREGEMLELVAPLSARTFAGGVIMPNLVPPVDGEERLSRYTSEVERLTSPLEFTPFMTLFMRDYGEDELGRLRERIIGVKLYPEGMTTHSDQGIRQIDDVADTLATMESLSIPLLVHGESEGFVMDRERNFLGTYEKLATKYPDLMIVMEHITTQDAVMLLDRYENLYATVTLQHLLITLDDVAGGMLNPHLFCKPIAKRPEDREALLEAALSSHPKLMFGSDSAPHPVDKKECCGCAAGVFTAPIALQVLVGLFEKHGALDNIQKFVSDNARQIYGVTPSHKTVRFERSGFEVPETYGSVVPMFAGQHLDWKVTAIDT